MKKVLYCAISSLILFSCTNEISYKINGTLADNSFDGKRAYIVNYDSQEPIDSTIIHGDSITFVGNFEAPIMARLIVKGAAKKTFVLEDGNISISYADNVCKGGKLNALFTQFSTKSDSIETAIDKIQNDTVLTKEIRINNSAKLIKELQDFYKNTYESNKDNPIGYIAFLNYTYDFNKAQVDSIMPTVPKYFNDMVRIKRWVDGAVKKENTSEGKKFTDFTIESEDGQKTKFSDYVGKGKYILVDFWASWCPPCRAEIKNLKNIYKEYHSKGLDILGVAVWDAPENTMTAIHELEIPWPQIINGQSIPTDAYGIMGIPHIIIFDPSGIIVSRGLYGVDLQEKVKSLIKD